MLEGIENSTSATVRDGTIDIGNTNYPNLVFHGVFDRDMRDWREEIINGEKTTRRIEVTLRNESGSEVLQIDFFNAFPIRYSLPPLSTENKTRFMERMEFAYSHFEIDE
ncbi:hypothetical protein GF373_07505 [bacterium]|nr:hypothetical protein [bacterium]